MAVTGRGGGISLLSLSIGGLLLCSSGIVQAVVRVSWVEELGPEWDLLMTAGEDDGQPHNLWPVFRAPRSWGMAWFHKDPRSQTVTPRLTVVLANVAIRYQM